MVDLRVERVDGEAGQRDWRYVHNLIIPTDPLSADEVRERAGRHRLDVAYVGDVLVGCMTVRPPEDGTPVATVIARILPEHRERGLGTLLYAHGLAQARELGAERIRTVVLESNPQGLRFALARGFVEVERYLLPGDSVPFIDLEAGLKPAGAEGARGSGST
ncbi:GNAT family N-acetyltransferase [Streptomyces sp. NBC_01408]|uniref:GNAT family N-acetyltransferase n=1 Tax=Streptomyces sp. NBC_01408 TaxID=2903855 RepID=UPI00225BF942|nr:GNAT family N-acetyltransferase [Streptomyces sp. NBC_01408]MCX4691844.1 GNAT family N-acetyltransferase [Streptomyces sp. NBC_01408]